MDEGATKSSVITVATSYIQSLEAEKRQIAMQRDKLASFVNDQAAASSEQDGKTTMSHVAAAQQQLSRCTASQVGASSSGFSLERAVAQQLEGLATMAVATDRQPLRQTDTTAGKSIAGSASHSTEAPAAASCQLAPTDNGRSVEGAHGREANENNYALVFESCPFPMAIAHIDGKFLACNKLFRQVTGHTKEELRSMNVFSITHLQDLQMAYDSLSKMMLTIPLSEAAGFLTPPAGHDIKESSDTTFTVMGSMPGCTNTSLRVDAIKTEQGTLRCLSVLLVETRGA